MINLIPKIEKKKLKRDFYYRLIILFLLMISSMSFISLVLLLPSYFLVSIKNNIIDNKLEIQKKEIVPLPDKEALNTIESLNLKLNLIEKNFDKSFFISKKVINAVLLKKIPSINITDISYEDDLVKGKKINIQGNAPSREILLSFRRALEDDVLFKKVDLPISNFIKGSDIKFSLILIPS